MSVHREAQIDHVLTQASSGSRDSYRQDAQPQKDRSSDTDVRLQSLQRRDALTHINWHTHLNNHRVLGAEPRY
jgi:hypothetical protein